MRIALILTILFSQIGSQAVSTLLHVFYTGDGVWRNCTASTCHADNQDWGADSLDYTLWLRWKTTGDQSLRQVAESLVPTATAYPPACSALPCHSWSDVPEWDTIADMREYEMLHDPRALAKARKAFAFVDDSKVFALGACPEIHYQLPAGQGNHLKTLETDANYIKAALLLYDATHERSYLDAALKQYGAVRARFLDSSLPLYSVYVFDDGKACTQVPHRFFASVNGDMIWNGIELARITGRSGYRTQALETARAIDANLSDGRAVFADLQAENDIVEPLVEAMWVLATSERTAFARSWILRNASAAFGERKPDGTYGRFFDGPIPGNMTTEWQSNGGLALVIAAAALAPQEPASTNNDWSAAQYTARAVNTMPATIAFDGSAIALIGAIGARCCEPGHARIFIDGKETFDGTGIWQNKSSSGKTLPESVLFAWQWPSRGYHTIRIEPGDPNAKEGGPFISLIGYKVK